MTEEITPYTGNLEYKSINFTFFFDRSELRLIPPKDKEYMIENEWGWLSIGEGAKTWSGPVYVDVDFLIGICNETRQKIIFIPKQGSVLSLNNSVVSISLVAYIVCKYKRDSIDRISFSCPEINYIHPVNQAITLTLPIKEFINNGVATISTQNFDVTTTEMQPFVVDDKEIKAYFGISRVVSTKIDEPPLRLDSSLTFEFESITDYLFIYKLWWLAREFIRFLCYRKNVFISKADISAPCEDGKHEVFATMYILGQDGEIETETLNKGRYIRQEIISGHEGEILSGIVNENLYLRHLPDTFQSGLHINAARFVMITAAFEWEFRKLYPDGVKKSPVTIKAEETVSDTIQKLIDETTGKQKEIYKFLKKLIKSNTLQAEIVQVGKDFSEILGAFGEHLYSLNKQKLNYSEMGKRLSNQRNNFAHGNLDKEFIGLSLLDLKFMEYVVYAMQLKYCGIEDIKIQKAINDLFHLNFAL